MIPLAGAVALSGAIISFANNMLTLISKWTYHSQLSVGIHQSLQEVASVIVDVYDDFIDEEFGGNDPMPNGVTVELPNGLKPIIFSRSIFNDIANGDAEDGFIKVYAWFLGGASYHPTAINAYILNPKKEKNDLGGNPSGFTLNENETITINPFLPPSTQLIIQASNSQRYIYERDTAFIWENWYYQYTDSNNNTSIVEGTDTEVSSLVDDLNVGTFFELYAIFLIIGSVINVFKPFPKLVRMLIEKFWGISFGTVEEQTLDKVNEIDTLLKSELQSSDDSITIEGKADILNTATTSLKEVVDSINSVLGLRQAF